MTEEPAYLPHTRPRRFPWGCVLSGCLGLVVCSVLGLLLIGASAVWLYQSQLAKYTSRESRTLPRVELSDEEIHEIEMRLEEFHGSLEKGEIVEPFVLSEDEINALISQQDPFRGRVYVDIEEGRMTAQVSMPTDQIPGGQGRYFNGEVTIEAELKDGELNVRVDQASVNDQPVPEVVLSELRKQNLAQEIMQDPEARKTLDRFESLRMEKDRIVLIPASPPDASLSPPSTNPETTDGPPQAELSDGDFEPL